jgi:methylated-DNA-[protein]-cysteine S-methyltransferase
MPERHPDPSISLAGPVQSVLEAGPPSPSIDRAVARLLSRLDAELPPRAWYDLIPGTLVGDLWVAASEQGLVMVDFDITEADLLAALSRGGRFRPVRDPQRVAAYRAAVAEYLNGTRRRLDLPVDLRALSPFQRSVLLAAREVPRGQVATYAEIARRIGRPRAFRAVGQALRNNPVPIVIPCHRVVNSDGTLGGYAGMARSQRKRDLLRLEGVALAG